jgi:hypothetical protein
MYIETKQSSINETVFDQRKKLSDTERDRRVRDLFGIDVSDLVDSTLTLRPRGSSYADNATPTAPVLSMPVVGRVSDYVTVQLPSITPLGTLK